MKGHGREVQRSQNLTFHTFFTIMAITVVNNYMILCHNGPLREYITIWTCTFLGRLEDVFTVKI